MEYQKRWIKLPLTLQQIKQTLGIINAARSIYETSAQVTMYIPLRVPSLPLPPYVHLDRSSQWHLSALLSMAVETMTLPSRGQSHDERIGLDALESSLNVTGNQRIAGLQCSIRHRLTMEPPEEVHGNIATDGRLPASSINGWELDTTFGDASQDMDFYGAGGGGSQKQEHIFGRVESLRGYGRLEAIADKDEPSIGMRQRRRLESRRVEKSVPRIPFWLPHASLMIMLGNMHKP